MKNATDQAVLVAQNLNKNYGLTDKVDKRLQLTERSSALTSKFKKVREGRLRTLTEAACGMRSGVGSNLSAGTCRLELLGWNLSAVIE